ncbi:hypothetical protein HK102_006133 [Quaeritorhiza haematococci]|nr:hypothetical protein HK102_006133 [Quaeritorhiza haematococci]
MDTAEFNLTTGSQRLSEKVRSNSAPQGQSLKGTPQKALRQKDPNSSTKSMRSLSFNSPGKVMPTTPKGAKTRTVPTTPAHGEAARAKENVYLQADSTKSHRTRASTSLKKSSSLQPSRTRSTTPEYKPASNTSSTPLKRTPSHPVEKPDPKLEEISDVLKAQKEIITQLQERYLDSRRREQAAGKMEDDDSADIQARLETEVNNCCELVEYVLGRLDAKEVGSAGSVEQQNGVDEDDLVLLRHHVEDLDEKLTEANARLVESQVQLEMYVQENEELKNALRETLMENETLYALQDQSTLDEVKGMVIEGLRSLEKTHSELRTQMTDGRELCLTNLYILKSQLELISSRRGRSQREDTQREASQRQQLAKMEADLAQMLAKHRDLEQTLDERMQVHETLMSRLQSDGTDGNEG